MNIEIRLRRVYDSANEDEELRVLVDRLWPRGISKEKLYYDLWVKDISPSIGLRKFLHTDIEKNWEVFRIKYIEELSSSTEFKELIKKIKTLNPNKITLLYSSKDRNRNNAVILQDEIKKHIKEL